MNNILRIEMKSLFNKFSSKMSIFVTIIFGLFLGIANKANGEPSCAGIFEYALVLLIFLSAIPGFYISNDFTKNTIRNKIITGNKRVNLYLGKFFAVSLFFLVCMILFVVSSIISNFILIGTDGINKNAFLYGLVLLLFCVMAVSAITTFIAMSLKNELGSLAPLLLMYMMMIFCMIGMELFNNSDVMKLICDILPISQLMTLNLIEVPNNVLIKVLYSVGLTLVLTVGGILIFRKTDLK